MKVFTKKSVQAGASSAKHVYLDDAIVYAHEIDFGLNLRVSLICYLPIAGSSSRRQLARTS